MEKNGNTLYKIMQDAGISGNTEICQYMDIDYLRALLSKEMYYVKRKKFFIDNREKSIPFKTCCVLNQYGKKFIPEQNARQESINQSAHKYEEISSMLLTSCWTERVTENALMWDRNGERHKACIKSTVDGFVAAFGQMEYTIWCGKMLYEYIHTSIISDDIIWYKEPYFSDEREVRFYFSKDFNNVIPDDMTNDHVLLSVNTKCLIKEIVLSPYIKREAAEEIRKSFQEKYKIVTKLSEIRIS